MYRLLLVALFSFFFCLPSQADTITSEDGSYSVSFDTFGDLTSFSRTAGGPQATFVSDRWRMGAAVFVPSNGVWLATGPNNASFSGFATPTPVTAIYGPNSATFNHTLTVIDAPAFGPTVPSAGPVLQTQLTSTFVASNVLRTVISVQNISGLPIDYEFIRRFTVDYDGNLSGSISDGLVTADPVVPFGSTQAWYGFPGDNPALFPIFGPPVPAAGLSAFAASGVGRIDVFQDGVPPGGTVSVAYYHALANPGQTGAELRAQLAGLGASYTLSITPINGRDDGTAAALATGPAPTAAVPAPPGIVLGALAGLSALGLRLRRRVN